MLSTNHADYSITFICGHMAYVSIRNFYVNVERLYIRICNGVIVVCDILHDRCCTSYFYNKDKSKLN